METAYNPQPLGYLIVAGAPVSIIANYPTYTDLAVKDIDVQAYFHNAGQVAIGYAGMNLATGIGVLKVLQGGESWSLSDPLSPGPIPARDFYIHGDTPGDQVLISVWRG